MESCNAPPRLVQRMAAFFELCKPRVNSLIVFTAMIGMWLAAPDMARPGGFLPASLELSDSLCRCASDGTVPGRENLSYGQYRDKRPHLSKDSSHKEQRKSFITLAFFVPKDSSFAAT